MKLKYRWYFSEKTLNPDSIIVSGTDESIVMVEGEADFISEDELLEVISMYPFEPLRKEVSLPKKNFGDKVSEITVRFVTEFILFIKDDSGKIINGSADSIKQSDDTWIFHKKKNNPNPNWLLVGTATNK